jgi:D-alanyl-D-alanine carboxypeptidase (penicillin-binding protein 5/6)
MLLVLAGPAAAQESPASPSPTPTAAAGLEIPDFATQAWIVADADTGDILAGQNVNEQRPMASTLKTLTALTLLPRLQYDSVYEARATETLTEGAHVGVLAGNRYTIEELFHGMLMRSGNDAAVALADAFGYQRTLDAMNAEARRIGANNTVAMSPNGLDQPGQVSTAADLAQIYRVAIQDPRLQQILTAKQAQFPGQPPHDPTKARGEFTIFNHDALLASDYPGFLGGKSGFTSQAGRTYVAGAQRDGRRLVVALLGIGGGTTQTARELLDWSFANLDAMTPIAELPAVDARTSVTAEPAASNADPSDLAPTPAQVQAVNAADTQGVYDQAMAVDSPTGTAFAATAIVGGYESSPFVAAEQPPVQPAAERGFFASVLVGLFKAFMWLLLFLGIAVVLLRIRAVRRINRRRAERAMRQAATGSGEAATTRNRIPSRTR